jgi:hypothetical protein
MKKKIKSILVFLMSIILISCLDSDKSKLLQVLEQTNKILVRATINGSMDLVKNLSIVEIENLKKVIHKIKADTYKDNNTKLRPAYQLILYKDDQTTGMLLIDSVKSNCINIHLSSQELELKIKTDFDFKRYFDELILNKNVDCTQTFHSGVDFMHVSLYDYIKILRIPKPCPNGEYCLTTFGKTGENWITDSDIENLIGLIDSRDTTYCIVQMISSNLPKWTDYSTLGGQIMNIIDSYRFNTSYPSFLCDCSKNDQNRKKEILEWSKNKKNK